MSASREKKNRQEQIAQGVQSSRQLQAAEAAKKERRSKALYITVAIVFVVVALFLLVAKSGIVQRRSTAIEINGTSYSPTYVDYYYSNAVTSFVNSTNYQYYGSSIGFNLQSPYDQQEMSDMAKVLCGVTDDSIITWDDYFTTSVKQNMLQVDSLCKAAKEAGFTFDDEMQADVDGTLESLKTYAASNGTNTSGYLKQVYGQNMTMSCFKSILHDVAYASAYQEYYTESLDYSDADLEEYYKENRNTYDVANYEYIYISGAAATVDAAGNTVTPTDADIAEAAQKAKDIAADVQARMDAGEAFSTIGEAYADDSSVTYRTVEDGYYNVNSDMAVWVFDDARVAGDTTLLDSSSGSDPAFYAISFTSRNRFEYNVINIRHILFTVDSSNLDPESATYAADLQALNDSAKAEAEAALEQWKSGDATEESFAALANELSADGGSNTNGGLYENVYKGKMVENFENWCFDSSRKVGDTGIVYNEGTYTGYHVMYFAGEGDPYWKVQVRSAMSNEAANSFMTSLTENAEIVEGPGMKYSAF